MQIEPGTSLAHYEIVSPLGRGGMGEVWRAKDTKLGREVAIKVLPADFTSDTERLARFDREARMLASLNHPHIASIHGFEDAGGLKFLVMELAGGVTIADRLRGGPIPIDEAIAISKQIVDALESAHEKGIIHRDLKPANVVIDDEGKVKVLDFGLAKALDIDESSSSNEITNSPTMIRAATNAGVILGTAAYMSPEQAKGKRVDRRADIWSLGVVLFEMLTGEKLFDGETVSETLASVLMTDVDLGRLPSATPPNVRKLIRRCLTRDPKQRLQAIGEARILLDEGGETAAVLVGAGRETPGRSLFRDYPSWALVAILAIALVFALIRGRTAEPEPQRSIAARLAVFSSESLRPDAGSSVIISPDGRTLVYVATAGSQDTQLFMQRLDGIGVVPIAGTAGAGAPFFSPDGEWIAFFSGGQLKKVATNGGAPLVICDVGIPRGGSWGESGQIVLAASLQGGLSLVSEDGGPLEPLTTLDESQSERSHRWPRFLPGSQAVLFQAQRTGANYEDSPIKVVSLEGRETKVVQPTGSYPRYGRSGHVLFARSGTLFAIPFDLATLEASGTPKPVLQELLSRTGNEATDDGTAHYDISSDGTLVYRRGAHGSNLSQMVVTDRENNRIHASRANNYLTPVLSPDAKRVAVQIAGDSGADIWVWDLERDTLSRLTFDGADESWPLWSPDGKRIVYTSARKNEGGTNTTQLYIKAADGSGAEVPVEGTVSEFTGATSWSRDGRTILFVRSANDGGVVDIAAVQLEGDQAGESTGIVATPAVELNGNLSPNGRWIAYQSNESGDNQVYASPFPGPGGKWQISVDGGTEPSWTRDGSEVIWRNAGQGHFAASITDNGESLSIGQPIPIRLEGRYLALPPFRMWDVSDDGQTFVFLETEESGEVDTRSVILVTQWFNELKRLAPVEGK